MRSLSEKALGFWASRRLYNQQDPAYDSRLEILAMLPERLNRFLVPEYQCWSDFDPLGINGSLNGFNFVLEIGRSLGKSLFELLAAGQLASTCGLLSVLPLGNVLVTRIQRILKNFVHPFGRLVVPEDRCVGSDEVVALVSKSTKLV